MQNAKTVGLVCLLWVLGSGHGFGATRYVNVSNGTPAQPFSSWGTAATNLQAAINAAESGDEILVAPGTYRTTNYVMIPPSKGLTLRGTTGRQAVLHAQQRTAALIVWGTNSVVEGFTVQYGRTTSYGGGIQLHVPSTVRDCLVISNRALGGGGILISSPGTAVENCTIQNNVATNTGGGILFYSDSTGRVVNCEISFNVASNSGGGVYVQHVGAISNCWIADNDAKTGNGGGRIFWRWRSDCKFGCCEQSGRQSRRRHPRPI